MKPLTYLMLDLENLQPSAEDIERLRGNDFRLWIFRGPHQSKFDEDLVVALQPLGDRVRHIKSSKNGKNALDFHVAFCLGQAQQQNSSAGYPARYIVVTKDGGFDSLFDYMRTLGCQVGRAHSIPEALKVAESLTPQANISGEGRLTGTETLSAPVNQASPEAAAAATPAATKAVTKGKAEPQPKQAPAKETALRTKMTADDVSKVTADLVAHPTNRPGDREALQRHIMTKLRNKVAEQVILAVVDELELQGVLTFNGKKVDYNLPKAKK